MIILCSFGCSQHCSTSNFLLLFLSPFSPPNTAKETPRKKCRLWQRFCVGAYKYGSRRVCKYGDSTITKCKYGRVGIVQHVDRSVTSWPITVRLPRSYHISHHFITISSSATCYLLQPKGKATAVILTAMHLQTPNCLPDRLIIS